MTISITGGEAQNCFKKIFDRFFSVDHLKNISRTKNFAPNQEVLTVYFSGSCIFFTLKLSSEHGN